MQVVCEATQSESEDVTEAAFECLVRIMQLYYDKMQFYMEKALFGVRSMANTLERQHADSSSTLFQLTVAGMNHSEEKVALQAIEFWSTVCEEEIGLKEAALEVCK